jgi:hypothetical protein
MSEEETLQLQRTIESMVEFTRVECPARHLFRVFGCEVKAILFGYVPIPQRVSSGVITKLHPVP